MAQSVDIQFSRELLKQTLADLKSKYPDLPMRDPLGRQLAWVYDLGRGHWEFHYLDFYWHGHASNAYEARANGWTAWMDSQDRLTRRLGAGDGEGQICG